ncbi:MAG: hypothetical protein ABR540_14775 [Acidimicrobiales bacterium]
MMLEVPTGQRARLLYGLTRCRPLPQPHRRVDGWDCYAAEGLDGDRYQIALRTSDHAGYSETDELALAGLRRGATDVGGLTELQVVLSRLLEFAGAAGLWCWQRVSEVLYGPGARPLRHNLPAKQWVALLSRGRVTYDPDTSTSPESWTQLVTLEEVHRSSRTVHLDPVLHRELAAVTYTAAATAFRFGPPTEPVDRNNPRAGERKVPNPEGNLPSRRARARIRASALLEVAPRRPGEKPKREFEKEIEPLLVGAGMDLGPVKRRRHVPSWALDACGELVKACTLLGVGIARVVERVGSVLRHKLRVERPPADDGGLPAQDAPAATRASRAPPRPA